MESFFRVVSREIVYSFGVDATEWSEKDHNLLTEGMILAWKENDRWTDEEATEECRKQVMDILFRKFKRTYGPRIDNCSCWFSHEAAFRDYRAKGKEVFEEDLAFEEGVSKFAGIFYDELREMFNIDTIGVYDEYKKMVMEGWSYKDYQRHLDSLKKGQKN
jgi:hypothetical protein